MGKLKSFFSRRDSQPQTPASISFLSMPVEIQIKILSYLPPKELAAIASVSKKWFCVAKDPSLWKSLRFYSLDDSPPIPNNLDHFLKILSTFPDPHCIQTLDVMDTPIPGLLPRLADATPNLKTLVASVGDVLDQNDEFPMLSRLASLTALTLKFKVMSPPQAVDKGIQALLQNGCSYTTLELYNCDILLSQTLTLLRNLVCTQLKYFGLNAANWILDDYERFYRKEEINEFEKLETIWIPTHHSDAIISNIAFLAKNSLKRVKIEGSFVDKDTPNRLSDTGVSFLLQTCKKLNQLYIYDTEGTDGISLDFDARDEQKILDGARLDILALIEVPLESTGLLNLTKCFGTCLKHLVIVNESRNIVEIEKRKPHCLFNLELFPNLRRLKLEGHCIYYSDPKDSIHHKQLRILKLNRCLVLKGTNYEDGCVSRSWEVIVGQDFEFAYCELRNLRLYTKRKKKM